MQPNYSRIDLRMFTEQILENIFPDETGAARLQQAGLFLLIYVLQGDKEPVTVSRLERITGQADAGINKQLNKLIKIGVVEKTQILNKQGRGRAFHLSIKDSAKTRRLVKAIDKGGRRKSGEDGGRGLSASWPDLFRPSTPCSIAKLKTWMPGSSPGMTAENPVRKKSVKYTAGEIGRVRVVEDFLPLPKALVPREENVKV